ncbi:MAG: tetratricopeptide repeat protein [Desulfitobacteriaceae bacterium]|nr:tetratricopeptide repeat protein [Desulfitobacteriaceae bacterium]MDD4346117.1 tetratricopeptide repeat protein [Desulfitobacteriaceae bacterium]MDD4401077.1 tetratricopeptide repeat protein [Desulfitobacteriaceae bacterium]
MKLSPKVIIILTILILVIGGGIAFAMNTPAARAERQFNLGDNYLQESKYMEAIPAFQKTIKLEPRNIPARLGLGQAYIAIEEFSNAEAVLKEVIDIDPNNIPAREKLFKGYVKAGDEVAANEVLKEISVLDPQKDLQQYDNDLHLAHAIGVSKASYDQAIIQMNDKQYLEALDSFQKVIWEDSGRYADAQLKTDDCKKAFVSLALQEAKDEAANKNYQRALYLTGQILQVDGSNQEASQLKNAYASILNQELETKNDVIQSLKNLLDEGLIPGIQFQIGTPISRVKEKFGSPDSEGYYDGGYYQKYGSYMYWMPRYDVAANITGITIFQGELLGVKIGNTKLKDVPAILGTPSAVDSMTYYGSKYTLRIEDYESNGIVFAVSLHKKSW